MNIALVDWGTSSLRVYSSPMDSSTLPTLQLEDLNGGILSVPPGKFEAAFEAALQRCGLVFTAQSPAILCGMVGSSIGWKEVPYVAAPATLAAVAAGCLHFATSTGRPVTIVPGVKCGVNANGQPDVMRGEETQVLGELQQQVGRMPPSPTHSTHPTPRVFCLPGTHSKWVVCRGGAIESLQTAMTGELFALLSKHSVLAGSVGPPRDTSGTAVGGVAAAAAAEEAEEAEEEAFEQGLTCPAPLHALFSVRTRDLFSGGGEAQVRAKAGNRGWLSGALLALELREASEWMAGVVVVPPPLFTIDSQTPATLIPVCVVGASPLAGRYAHAMEILRVGQPVIAAPHAAARGLILLAGLLGIAVPNHHHPSTTTTTAVAAAAASTPPLGAQAQQTHQQRMDHLAQCLKAAPMVAILRGVDPSSAPAIGLALYSAGVRVIEVPLNSPDHPLDSVKALVAAFAHLPKEERPLIGAGTVLSVEDVGGVARAGGEIVLAPNADERVIRAARAAGLPVFPGVATPSEAFASLQAGASGLKLFPCTAISIATIGALRAVLPKGVCLLAVGGVGAANGGGYLAAGCAALGVGSAVFEPGNTPEEVGEKARQLLCALAGGRQ